MTEPELTIGQFGPADAVKSLPRRRPGAHKWSVGGVMIVAGAPGYVGAAILCAMAAGRAGAGIVNLAVHRPWIPSIAPVVPEASFTILPDGDLGSTSSRLLETVAEKASKCAAFVVGPGLGDDDYARQLVSALLGISARRQGASLGFGSTQAQSANDHGGKSLLEFERPIVVDADGLNALATIDDWWVRLPEQRLVLTPHVGEMSRLMNLPTDEIVADPERVAMAAAKRFRQSVLLKGNPTVVTDGRTLFRAIDAPLSLATAGSGDVLAGTIGALLAQGLSLLDAANLGVFAGIRAARRLEVDLGTLGVIAGDLPRAIAIELAALERA
jgi:ADP-dependent NAD(P)H-hydrate dehydratase / NAD(P)H-hydrate epimerase